MNIISLNEFPESIQKSFINFNGIQAEKVESLIISNFEKSKISEELFLQAMDIIYKGGKHGNIGEIRVWNNIKYQKTPKGWRPLKGQGSFGMKAATEEKDEKPLNQRIEETKSFIANAEERLNRQKQAITAGGDQDPVRLQAVQNAENLLNLHKRNLVRLEQKNSSSTPEVSSELKQLEHDLATPGGERSEEEHKMAVLKFDFNKKLKEIVNAKGSGWVEGFNQQRIRKHFGEDKTIKEMKVILETDASEENWFSARVGSSKSFDSGSKESKEFDRESTELANMHFATAKEAQDAAQTFAEKWNEQKTQDAAINTSKPKLSRENFKVYSGSGKNEIEFTDPETGKKYEAQVRTTSEYRRENKGLWDLLAKIQYPQHYLADWELEKLANLIRNNKNKYLSGK